ncbi:unnamed protein product [Orchesella dallaii]|uniref:Peptidase S1 domain-containing protein n=1 Tax=Orchesella dallaii TaxID=48710 RepID=A0ABP1RUT0_9HEXA
MKVSIKLALVGLLVLATISNAASKKKGKKGMTKLTNCGKELPKENKDYLHQLIVTNADTNSICGGTWISKDIVVTAGHCVINSKGMKSNPGSITVVTDIRDSSKGLLGLSFANGKSRSVKDVALPKDFKKISDTYFSNDVAVIKLNPEFHLFGNGDKKDKMEGKYASLPEGKDVPTSANEVGYLTPATGLFAKSKSTKLFERAITMVDKAECAKDENMEDAKADVESGKTICGKENCSVEGLCERMTGGGLICKGDVLCGIQTLHNCDEDEEKLPQGYLNVAEYKAWIDEKVGEMNV